MAKKIVRGITAIKEITKQCLSTNNVNDLLSDGEHNYIHRKKKDKTEEYHCLTDNVKTVTSTDTTLLAVTNYNKTNNSVTLTPKHDTTKQDKVAIRRYGSTNDEFFVYQYKLGDLRALTVQVKKSNAFITIGGEMADMVRPYLGPHNKIVNGAVSIQKEGTSLKIVTGDIAEGTVQQGVFTCLVPATSVSMIDENVDSDMAYENADSDMGYENVDSDTGYDNTNDTE